nr:MAG TPA: hypothetical protein [Caudoviricetes sp.]
MSSAPPSGRSAAWSAGRCAAPRRGPRSRSSHSARRPGAARRSSRRMAST